MNLLVFANPFYGELFRSLKCSNVNVIFVTLEGSVADDLINKGFEVVGCFERDYDKIIGVDSIEPDYLVTSFSADRFLGRYNYDKRIEILKKEISFWRSVVNNYKPDFIVNETVTIEFSEVMEIEARKAGIKYYSFLSGFLPYTFYWKDNAYDSVFNSIDNNFTENDIKNAKEYISKIQAESLKPFYVRNLKKYNVWSNIFSIITRKVPHFLYYWIADKRKNHFVYIYNSLESLRCLKRSFNLLIHKYEKYNWRNDVEYVFYPLHYEPEATLSYFNNPHVDQATVIETVARALNINQILVVKEHPQQLGALFEDKFRLVKKRNPNIIYLPGTVSSEDVMRHSKLIVTLTSTAGWEAYIRKIPVIVLGNVFYKKFPGVMNATFSELKDIFRKGEYLVGTDKEILDSVSFMMSRMKKGAPYPYKDISSEQRNSDFSEAIELLASNEVNRND